MKSVSQAILALSMFISENITITGSLPISPPYISYFPTEMSYVFAKISIAFSISGLITWLKLLSQ